MKKILIPFLVLMMLAVAIIPVSAGKGPGEDPGTSTGRGPYDPATGPQPDPFGLGIMTTYRQSSPRGIFSIVGTISAIDTTNKVLTVTVSRANKLAKSFIDVDVYVVTTEKTRFLYKIEKTSPATTISFEELATGDQVSILGLSLDDTWTALRVTKGELLTCLFCLP